MTWQIVAVTWSQGNDIGCELGDYQLVRYQNLAAIVTRSEHMSIDRLPTLEKVNALFNYQSILERAGINRTIIPVKFGTEVKRKRDVVMLLERNSSKLRSLLNYAKDKAEFDLMGIWKKSIGNLDTNIFHDLEKEGYEIKPHQNVNRAICFHFSILMSQNEQKTFATFKEDLDKKFGDEIDVRISEPLPPYNFFTVDIKEGLKQRKKPGQKTIKND